MLFRCVTDAQLIGVDTTTKLDRGTYGKAKVDVAEAWLQSSLKVSSSRVS